MNRVFVVGVLTVVSIALSGGAWAAPKPPRTACLSWGLPFVSVLVIKPFGTVTTSAGKTKIYALYGELLDVGGGARPLSGTGHMVGNVFHLGFTAASAGGIGNLPAFTFEGHYDVVLQAGTGEASYYGGGLAGSQFPTVAIAPVNCAGGVIPYGNKSEGHSSFFAPFESNSEE